MLEFRRVVKLAFFFKVFKYHRISLLYEDSGIRCLRCKVSLSINELNKRKIVFTSYICIIFTKCRSDMNDSGTICHCDIRVTSYEEALLMLLVSACFSTCIERFIFLMFKVTALICLK